MEGPTVLAQRLHERRTALAGAILERLGPRSAAHISPLIVRSLIDAIGKSIQTDTPDAVVAWASMANGAYSPTIIHDVIAAGCDVAAQSAESLDLDFSALLVFLETIQANIADAFPLAVDISPDDDVSSSGTMVESVLAVLKARDETTATHSQATGAWCRRLCEAMRLSGSETDRILKAGILHDVGKIATPDAILFKPGPLTADEWRVMQQHADIGAEILADLATLSEYAPIVRAHHENWDGSGYPRGLKGEQIPFEARVIAVADAFHAMISLRPYRAAISQRDAMTTLRTGRGTQWDAGVVDAMIKMLDAPRPHEGRGEVARG
jgi:putative nucleotidyltransferase with HDIG domain